jgi:uncharacterized protein (UPF0305 family)
MDPKELNISIEEFRDYESKQITATFEDLVERLQDCNWEWHNIDHESEEFITAKNSYERVVSCLDALRAKYFEDKIMMAKIKKIHNQYAPNKYDIP